MKRPLEFYKDLESLKKQGLKLLFVFGNKDYQKIKKLPDNIQAYISLNAEEIKRLGFSNFKILLDDYGLYNIDSLVKRSSPEFLIELSKKPDLIKDADQMMINKLASSEIIHLEDAPRIKVMFSDYFESELYKNNPELIEKIFSGTKLLTADLKKLLLSGIDIFKIPTSVFNEDIKKFLDSKVLSLEQLKEIISILGDERLIFYYLKYYDKNIDYKLNAWNRVLKDEPYDSDRSAKAILKLMGIKTSYELLVSSKFYNGAPINISDYITEDLYNDAIALADQKLISFQGFKGLYDYFPEADVKEVVNLILTSYKSRENEGAYYTDKNSGFDLISMINNGNYTQIYDLVPKGIISNWDGKKSLRTNIFICDEWLKVLTEEEKNDKELVGFINYFSKSFPYQNAREILDKWFIFKKLKDQIGELDYYALSNDTLKALIGSMTIFDVFNNPDAIPEVINIYKEIRQDKFCILFAGMTSRLSPNFLNNIKVNYKELSKKVGHLSEENYIDFLNPKYNDFIEMSEDYENYKNIHSYVSAAVYKMKKSGRVSEEYCRYYSNMYEKAVARQGLAIPYINGQSEHYSFDSLRLWDGRLASFDIESGATISKDAKDKLFTNNNCRLVEVKDRNREIIEQVYIQIDEDNNVSLSSLIGLNNEAIKQQIYNEIIAGLDKEFKAQGIMVKYAISNTIQNLVPNISAPKLFDEPVKEITIQRGDRLENRPEYNDDRLKISSIEHMAFWVADGKWFDDGLYTKGDSSTFCVGRDWFIKTAKNTLEHFDSSTREFIKDPRPNTYIDFIARHSASKENLGQKEMYDYLENMIYNSTDLFYVASHPTSYYGIAKMAAEGKMFILSDYQKVQTGEGLQADCKTIRTVVDENNNYNFNNIPLSFTSGYEPMRDRSAGKTANEIEFISPCNLSLEQQQKMVEQQQYYSALVKYLEEEREKEKRPEKNFNYTLFKDSEELYRSLEEQLPGVKNLRGYSIGYLKELLRRQDASQFVVYRSEKRPRYSV